MGGGPGGPTPGHRIYGDMECHLAGGKEPELVREVELYRLEIVGLTSTHKRTTGEMAMSCFCGSENGAGWANKGAAQSMRGNSPSLNKHWVSAGSMSIICLCFSYLFEDLSHLIPILVHTSMEIVHQLHFSNTKL